MSLKLSDYSRVIMVRVQISGLPGIRKTDHQRTQSLVSTANTTKRHARVTKTLFADSKLADSMSKIAASTRNWLRYASLPGEVDGKYLIPAKQFEKIGDQLRKFEHDYNAAVEKFVSNLEDEIEGDRKAKNNLFDAHDYPTEDDIRSATRFAWGFEPLPESSSFVKMFDDEALVADMQKQHDQHVSDLFSSATSVNLERLENRIRQAIASLVTYKGRKGQRLQGSKITEGLKEQAQLSRDLNVSNDAVINEMAQAVLDLLDNTPDWTVLRDAPDRGAFVGDLRSILGKDTAAAAVVTPEPPVDEQPADNVVLVSDPAVLAEVDAVEDMIKDETDKVSVGTVDVDSLDF